MTDHTEKDLPGPGDSFDACVAHFAHEDGFTGDPHDLCGWIHEHKEVMADWNPDEQSALDFLKELQHPGAEAVLTDLSVTYVSGVESPAQDSQWVFAKDVDHLGADWGVTAPLVLHAGTQTTTVDGGGRAPIWSKDGQEAGTQEEQKAWAPVLIPNEVDKQGDVIPVASIEKAAHEFLATYRKIDTDHDLFEGKGTPIESWTLKEATTFTLPDGSESREYPKGTWMMGVEFVDEAWGRIKSGELTGFSIYGEATATNVQEILGGEVDLSVGASPKQATAKGGSEGVHEEHMDDENTNNGSTESSEKSLPADALQGLVNSLNAYLASEQTSLGDANLQDFLQWGLDSGEIEADSLSVGGEDLTPTNEGGEGAGDQDQGSESEESGAGSGSGGSEQPPAGAQQTQSMEDTTPEGEGSDEQPEPSTKELLEDVRDTVKSTQESVESHGERIEALENAVFEKGEGEQEGKASGQPDEATLDEAAEKAVKGVLGLDDLPDDPEERQAVVRKHLHEQAEDLGLGNPDDWSAEDVAGVVR